ncbi:MAG: helix-hairpin-helix domain-containing protein, partial [Patescibacteria group bacterium]
SPDTLSQAIGRNDTAYLTKVSGIGRKLAEKIVLELKDKIPYLADQDDANFQQDTDVMLALQAMGYNEREVREALKKLPADIADTSAKIKFALKNLHH